MEPVDLREPAKQLQTITVTHSPRGIKLQQPLTLKVPKPNNRGEEDLHRYIIDSLSWKMPRLIQFTFSNTSTLEVAKHLLRHCTKSTATLYQYIYGVYRFCKWANTTPDQLITGCYDKENYPNPKAIAKHVRLLDDFIGCLQADGLAPGTINNHVKGVKALYRTSRLRLELPYRLSKRTVYYDRSPTPEELQHLMDLAGLREKVIISCLALGGFRIGTLVKLQYRHVKRDLEKGIEPIHVHVESEITKGKYHDYDTFLGKEATEYIRAYLDYRRRGSPCGKMPPETINEESPLIRNEQCRYPRAVTPSTIHRVVHNLYLKAGLIQRISNPTRKSGRRYELRVHSIRKYFRTQMAALGVERDYIEYMMGHTISTYHDIRMKGIEFLRGIYTASGLSIKPKTRISKIDALKEIIRAWGMNPDQILTKKALAEPHRTFINPWEREQIQIRELSYVLKKAIIRELQKADPENGINSHLEDGSPGEIRTLVSGSRAQSIQNQTCVIDDIDHIVSDFWEYCKVEERLSKKVSNDYKNAARRFLKLSDGEVSRQAIREFLKLYVDKAPRTYNNIIDALKVFIGRYLNRKDLLNGLKHTYVPENYERKLPTKEQLCKGFEALDTDKERAIYFFYATTGLRRSEGLNLMLDDVDFETRCVKARHDTRTKRAGVTFYN